MMTPQHNSSQPKMDPPESGLAVRLYNPGFGDCLLLAFRGEDGNGRYMLIDCGVHHQYPDRVNRIRLVAEDIAEATGKHLHVVVPTHEHTDHLDGFKHAKDIFDQFEIDHLWLAWTEDPNDATARELKQRYGMQVRALEAVVGKLRLAKSPIALRLQRVLDFESPAALASSGDDSPELDYLRQKSKVKLLQAKDYRNPGETPLTLPGVNGVKIYVLGPPREVKWIRSLERKSELYPELTDLDMTSAFASAALCAMGKDTDEDQNIFRRSRPFDEAFEIQKDQARDHPEYGRFFRQNYGFVGRRGHGPAWRRIETDWLAAAEQMALDLNSKTNNTSLVLAVELTETQPKKVLIFAADAQVGNWLSWHEITWAGEGEGGSDLTVKELLSRTVFYKVGHHGSHNATLSHKGLEMMGDDLVAMIPVDQKWANEKMNWQHPAHNLFEALEGKTSGRVIRSDKIPSGNQPPAQHPLASDQEWQQFVGKLDWDRGPNRLWFQYTVSG